MPFDFINNCSSFIFADAEDYACGAELKINMMFFMNEFTPD